MISRDIATTWAVGVTTSPRDPVTLFRTLDSLSSAGFGDVITFAEPLTGRLLDVDQVIRRPLTIAEPRFDTTASEGRFGCWQNYVQSLADLLEWKPDADVIMLVQDDVVFSHDVKELLELWPTDETGVVSLWSSNRYETGECGFKRINDPHLIGALAYVFPRAVVEDMLEHELASNWNGAARAHGTSIGHLKKAADAWVGHVLQALHREVYYMIPSLSQHIAETSTLSNGSNDGFRRSDGFIGESASALTWLPQPVAAEVVRAPDAAVVEPVRTRDTIGRGRRYRSYRDDQKPTVHVVIPAVNEPDLTIECLQHLAANDWPMVVHYVDNGSNSETKLRVLDELERLFAHRYWPELVGSNRGFTHACNRGIQLARACGADRPVLLLNNDCNVGPQTIERLYRAMTHRPKVGAVGPLTCDRGDQSLQHRNRLKMSGLRASLSDLKQQTAADVESQLHNRTTSRAKRLAFFCTLLSAESIAQVGPLPSEFTDGLGADDAWCLAAAAHGYRVEVVNDSFAHHQHSATFASLKINRPAAQVVARRKLSRR